MKIDLHKIPIRELVRDYVNSDGNSADSFEVLNGIITGSL